MKKRPFPIALVSLMVIVIGAIAFMTVPGGSFGAEEMSAEQAIRDLEVGPSRATPDKASLTEIVKTARKNPKLEGGSDITSMKPDYPSILVPKIKHVKPRPNDSTVAGHWYREESRNANR
jgi:hypothetical protein